MEPLEILIWFAIIVIGVYVAIFLMTLLAGIILSIRGVRTARPTQRTRPRCERPRR